MIMKKTIVSQNLLIFLAVFQIIVGIAMIYLGVYVNKGAGRVKVLENDFASGLISVRESINHVKDGYTTTAENVFTQIEVLKHFSDKTHSCAEACKKSGKYMQTKKLLKILPYVPEYGKSLEGTGEAIEKTSKGLKDQSEAIKKFQAKGHPEIISSFDKAVDSLKILKAASADEHIVSNLCNKLSFVAYGLALVFLFNGLFVFPIFAMQMKNQDNQ